MPHGAAVLGAPMLRDDGERRASSRLPAWPLALSAVGLLAALLVTMPEDETARQARSSEVAANTKVQGWRSTDTTVARWPEDLPHLGYQGVDPPASWYVATPVSARIAPAASQPPVPAIEPTNSAAAVPDIVTAPVVPAAAPKIIAAPPPFVAPQPSWAPPGMAASAPEFPAPREGAERAMALSPPAYREAPVDHDRNRITVMAKPDPSAALRARKTGRTERSRQSPGKSPAEQSSGWPDAVFRVPR
jgi:hypothetical protein